MYARPRTIEEAADAMSAPGALALCGGTDVFPAHAGRPLTRPVVDLSGIAALKGIAETPEGFRFGAATSWSMIAKAALAARLRCAESRGARGGLDPDPEPRLDRRQSLQRLARGRWRAAASGARCQRRTCLADGRRVLALSAFITGYRKTALRQGEIVTAVIVPKPAASAR